MQPSFFKNLGPISIDEINNNIDCNTVNISKGHKFDNLVNTSSEDINSVTFVYDNEILKNDFKPSTAILCTQKKSIDFDSKKKLILVKDVQYAVAILSKLFYREYFMDEIDQFENPKYGKNCNISKNAIIEKGVIIGDNVLIRDGVVIKQGCVIGNNCQISYNSVISNSIFGDNIYIGRNCSIGQQGFGFSIRNNNNIRIFHIGKVVLRSNVNIGSNCTIDRGSFSDTILGENVYLDNLCHIAHNVEVGSNSVFAAMTGIAGSAKIGSNVMAGGQTGIAGHITIGNNVRIAAKSGIFNNVDDNNSVMGYPAINMFSYLKKYKKAYEK